MILTFDIRECIGSRLFCFLRGRIVSLDTIRGVFKSGASSIRFFWDTQPVFALCFAGNHRKLRTACRCHQFRCHQCQSLGSNSGLPSIYQLEEQNALRRWWDLIVEMHSDREQIAITAERDFFNSYYSTLLF